MGVPDDAAIATGVRRWVDQLAHGTREDREELAGFVEEAGWGFPAELAATALAQLDTRTLWKTFDDTELQDLYDLASEAELSTAAERFKAAALARPYIDDGKIPPEIREFVMERDGHHCQECGGTEDLTIDHKIVPWSEGGSSTDPANLQVLCRQHNSSKGTRPWTPPTDTDGSTP
jgi:5-methylcytosine-specific restriction protein A